MESVILFILDGAHGECITHVQYVHFIVWRCVRGMKVKYFLLSRRMHDSVRGGTRGIPTTVVGTTAMTNALCDLMICERLRIKKEHQSAWLFRALNSKSFLHA